MQDHHFLHYLRAFDIPARKQVRSGSGVSCLLALLQKIFVTQFLGMAYSNLDDFAGSGRHWMKKRRRHFGMVRSTVEPVGADEAWKVFLLPNGKETLA